MSPTPARGNLPASSYPYSPHLRRLMEAVGISSYRALSTTAGVSRAAINRLRQGQLGTLRVETLQQLSQALQVAPTVLLAQFGDYADPMPSPVAPSQAAPTADHLRQEYDRLQQQLATQEQAVRQRFQQEAITLIESWLITWPTLVYAVQQDETFLATQLIPHTRPLDDLLKAWEITAIGPVGVEVAYDPQIHQPIQGVIAPGQRVQICHVGYYHGDRLLYRAKVRPVS